MNFNEIRNYDWKISDNLNVTHNRLPHLSAIEHECHFNMLRKGLDSPEPEIRVCCSWPRWLLKLSRCSEFTMTDILISSSKGNTGEVLQVTGILGISQVQIRKHAKKELTPEEKQRRREALTKAREAKAQC